MIFFYDYLALAMNVKGTCSFIFPAGKLFHGTELKGGFDVMGIKPTKSGL